MDLKNLVSDELRKVLEEDPTPSCLFLGSFLDGFKSHVSQDIDQGQQARRITIIEYVYHRIDIET